MVGQTISHYLILDKLGEGGMGVVYKAQDTKLRRDVALKFLSEHALLSETLRERFLREAQAAAILNHPNICTVHGIEESDGYLFIVMAYVPGETLQQRVSRGPLPASKALDVIIPVGEGIHEAHKNRVVHRDIKSANIILSPGGKAVIMDFGLALLAERTRITRAGTTLGTVAYMSPEQALAKNVDRRTDIWSLGVVLYELVTGRFPFTGDTAHAVCRSILTDPPHPITAARKKAPKDLGWLLNKALAKRPEERYQHMDDFLVDLRAVRKKLPADEPEEIIEAPPRPTRASDNRTVTLYEGKTITIDTELRERAEQGARGGGLEALGDSKKADSGHWKLALVALAVIVLLGMAFIWWRSLS